MRLMPSQFTVAELIDMLDRQNLVVNKDYQRSPRIWPAEAKSYFIDTILEGYPFPKLYFYETYDKKRRKPLREIVDGQQRVTTFVDYSKDAFRLSSASKRHAGLLFSELTEEQQSAYLMPPVQVDIIMAADRPEVLEMFRRMNAYTIPLNPAEKRHGEFQGAFKWFIVELADSVSPVLEQFGIFSSKQILRMYDAEFITDLAVDLDLGITNRQSRDFLKIYRKYDETQRAPRGRGHGVGSTTRCAGRGQQAARLSSYPIRCLNCGLRYSWTGDQLAGNKDRREDDRRTGSPAGVSNLPDVWSGTSQRAPRLLVQILLENAGDLQ